MAAVETLPAIDRDGPGVVRSTPKKAPAQTRGVSRQYPEHFVNPEDPFEHRHYQPYHPTCNKILAKRWEDHTRDIHLVKLKQARPTIDNGQPRVYPHLEMRLKRMQIEEERLRDIERKNHILLDRIAFQMMNPSEVSNLRFVHSPSEAKLPISAGPSPKRKRDMKQISQENLTILQRIEDKAPYYNRLEWLADRKKNVGYLVNIAQYPKTYVRLLEDGEAEFAILKPASRPAHRRKHGSKKGKGSETDKLKGVADSERPVSRGPGPIIAPLSDAGSNEKKATETSDSKKAKGKKAPRPHGPTHKSDERITDKAANSLDDIDLGIVDDDPSSEGKATKESQGAKSSRPSSGWSSFDNAQPSEPVTGSEVQEPEAGDEYGTEEFEEHHEADKHPEPTLIPIAAIAITDKHEDSDNHAEPTLVPIAITDRHEDSHTVVPSEPKDVENQDTIFDASTEPQEKHAEVLTEPANHADDTHDFFEDLDPEPSKESSHSNTHQNPHHEPNEEFIIAMHTSEKVVDHHEHEHESKSRPQSSSISAPLPPISGKSAGPSRPSSTKSNKGGEAFIEKAQSRPSTASSRVRFEAKEEAMIAPPSPRGELPPLQRRGSNPSSRPISGKGVRPPLSRPSSNTALKLVPAALDLDASSVMGGENENHENHSEIQNENPQGHEVLAAEKLIPVAHDDGVDGSSVMAADPPTTLHTDVPDVDHSMVTEEAAYLNDGDFAAAATESSNAEENDEPSTSIGENQTASEDISPRTLNEGKTEDVAEHGIATAGTTHAKVLEDAAIHEDKEEAVEAEENIHQSPETEIVSNAAHGYEDDFEHGDENAEKGKTNQQDVQEHNQADVVADAVGHLSDSHGATEAYKEPAAGLSSEEPQTETSAFKENEAQENVEDVAGGAHYDGAVTKEEAQEQIQDELIEFDHQINEHQAGGDHADHLSVHEDSEKGIQSIGNDDNAMQMNGAIADDRSVDYEYQPAEDDQPSELDAEKEVNVNESSPETNPEEEAMALGGGSETPAADHAEVNSVPKPPFKSISRTGSAASKRSASKVPSRPISRAASQHNVAPSSRPSSRPASVKSAAKKSVKEEALPGLPNSSTEASV
ncbi:hypothetical protein HDU67_006611 [Dinochytrium kinnereticum]|nr:hypothetical protein HDU67_006611 [Dinochytrium kinnereticum]